MYFIPLDATVCGSEDVEPEVYSRSLPQLLLSIDFFKAGPITEPGSHHSARPVE